MNLIVITSRDGRWSSVLVSVLDPNVLTARSECPNNKVGVSLTTAPHPEPSSTQPKLQNVEVTRTHSGDLQPDTCHTHTRAYVRIPRE